MKPRNPIVAMYVRKVSAEVLIVSLFFNDSV
jgi:hypothetical protein